MKKIILLLPMIILTILLLGGCETQPPTNYKLENIYVDPVDIKIGYDDQDSSRLCFDVKNNAQTTLLSQIEIIFDKTGEECFSSIGTKKLSEIPPKDVKHTCIDLRLPWESRKEYYKEQCKEKRFDIVVSLQDVTGVELDRGTTSIGII